MRKEDNSRLLSVKDFLPAMMEDLACKCAGNGDNEGANKIREIIDKLVSADSMPIIDK